MTDEPTPADWDKALARYAVIAPLVARDLQPAERDTLRREILAATHRFPGDRLLKVASRTLRQWCQLYRQHSIAGLLPKTRKDKGIPRTIPPDVIEKAKALRAELPSRSAETIASMLTGPEQAPVSASTVAYHLRTAGVPKTPDAEPKAFRRFEHNRPNDCWQSDLSDGLWLPDPTDPTRARKCYLHAFLDDHSRLITHAAFYWRESLPALEDCFRQAIAKHGIPSLVYWDNGSVFRAQQLRRMAARLGIQIAFATPYAPEGKGKIERYFATVKGAFFPEAQAAGITTLDELNRFFWAWLDQHYQRRKHSETKQTPLDRWEAGRQHVRFPSPEELRDTFLWEDERWVRKTGTVVLARNEYPVDPVLIGQRVIVRFDPFDLSQVHIVHRGRRIAIVAPQALVSRTFNKAQPHVPTAPRQLASSQAFKERLVAESDTARTTWGQLTDSPSPGQLTQPDLSALLNAHLGPDLTGDGRVAAFWSRHAPLKADLTDQALATAIASKGADRHLDFYLEAIRAAHWGGEA